MLDPLISSLIRLFWSYRSNLDTLTLETLMNVTAKDCTQGENTTWYQR